VHKNTSYWANVIVCDLANSNVTVYDIILPQKNANVNIFVIIFLSGYCKRQKL